MAIYHFSVKNISRSSGRSSVAASAYRAGEKLVNERDGLEHDYSKRSGVELAKLYAPEQTPEELLNRQVLWNLVEATEKRKNSQLAREFEIAFPCELNAKQREAMLDDLCQQIVARHGVVVDACIHAPHTATGSDERNYHAHIMLTTRRMEKGQLTEKTREFNDTGKQEVEYWREAFAQIANKHLQMAGHTAQIDHRSYKAQQTALEPTQHEGYAVTQLRRQGIDTRISLKNDAIKQRNSERIAAEQLISSLDQEIYASQRTMNRLQQRQRAQTIAASKPTPPEPVESQESKIRRANVLINAMIDRANTTAAQQLKHELEQIRQTAKPMFEELTQLKNNRPLFFGAKQHQQKIDELTHRYDQIKAQHDSKKSAGVTPERLQQVHQQLKQTDPDYPQFMAAVGFLKQLDEQRRQQQALKEAQDPERQAYLQRKALRDAGKHEEANRLLAEYQKANQPSRKSDRGR